MTGFKEFCTNCWTANVMKSYCPDCKTEFKTVKIRGERTVTNKAKNYCNKDIGGVSKILQKRNRNKWG